MTVARFAVVGQLDGAGGYQEGTVLIDRVAGTYAVRVKRRRRVYALPHGVVATLVCRAIVMAEAREKRRAKASKRKRRTR